MFVRSFACLTAVSLLAPFAAVSAPKKSLPAADTANFTSDSRLVLVPVTVTDHFGKTVSDLKLHHFQVSDDSKAAEIVSFGRTDAPVLAGIVFDLSSSMQRKLPVAMQAARELVNALGPEDAGYVVTFDKAPRVQVPLTHDVSALNRGLMFATAHGNTALFDAIKLGLDQGKNSGNFRKVLIVISDGGDNRSHLQESQLVQAALEADTQIYCIGVHERLRPKDEVPGAAFMERVSRLTGGLYFDIRTGNDIPEMTERARVAMKEQYLIGFKPSADEGTRDRWRRVKVKVNVPGSRLQVVAKSAYYHE